VILVGSTVGEGKELLSKNLGTGQDNLSGLLVGDGTRLSLHQEKKPSGKKDIRIFLPKHG